MSDSPIHFYLTFNPYLNTEYEAEYTQAHEFYDFLKDLVKEDKSSTCYWGKMIGKDRESQLDLDLFKSIVEKNTQNQNSTHLYITDFQNLWVAKVESIKDELPKKAHTLPFYADKKVEIWFEISDMTLLEYSHDKTAQKLTELYIDNPHMDLVINGMSPFTTGIKYPCFLQDLSEEAYFEQFDTSEFSHLILKPHPGIDSNSTGHILKCIYNYSIHEPIYAKIPHSARVEIESAEIDMMEHKHYNVHRVAFSYLKALEVIMNDLVIGHLKRSGQGMQIFVDATSAPPKLFFQHTKDYLIPLKQFNKNFSLNQILYFLERAGSQNHLGFRKAFSDHKAFVKFVTGDFQKLVKENNLIGIRNAIAHGEIKGITSHDAMAVRNLVLGVGCKGIINQLYQTFYPHKFRSFLEVKGEKIEKADMKKGKLRLVS